jgi:hypothetical protein
MKPNPVDITIYNSFEDVFIAGVALAFYYITEALGFTIGIDPVGYLLILFACWFILERIMLLTKRIIKYFQTVFLIKKEI